MIETKADTNFKVEYVSIASIAVDGDNHRRKKPVEHIQSLAESMGSLGQLQPIGVMRSGKGKYTLVYGNCRYRAAKTLGWTRITAVIMDEASAVDVHTLRATENLYRQNLTLMEEVKVVSVMVESVMKKQVADKPDGVEFRKTDDEREEDAITDVCKRLGRTVPWVRDRMFLNRLSPAVQEAVALGHFPLRHARELSKLADHELQDQIYGWAVYIDRDAGTVHRVLELSQLKRTVTNHLRSLKVVPWVLDEECFGRPRCNVCPNNTDNAPRLFDYDGKDDPDYEKRCLEASCFTDKQKKAEAAINRKVALLVKQNKKKEFHPSKLATKALSDHPPAGVKGATFARRVQKVLVPATVKKGDGPARKGKAVSKATAETKAKDAERNRRQDHQNRVSQWENEVVRKMIASITANPRLLLPLMAMRHSAARSAVVEYSRKNCQSPDGKIEKYIAGHKKFQAILDLICKVYGRVDVASVADELEAVLQDVPKKGDHSVSDAVYHIAEEVDLSALAAIAKACCPGIDPIPQLAVAE